MNIDFLFIGPQKTGTSWVDRQLRTHPQIQLPQKVKETFFFDKHYFKGLNWYSGFFPAGKSGGITGEVAPSYFHCKEAIRRILYLYPDCRILITLRNPVERIFSLYIHFLRYGLTDLPFLSAMRECPRFIQTSRILPALKLWTDAFGMEKCLILFFEDMRSNPGQFIRSISEFLGVRPSFDEEALHTRVNAAMLPRYRLLAQVVLFLSIGLKTLNHYGLVNRVKKTPLKAFLMGGGKIPVMSEEERRFAGEYFSHEIDELEEFLQRDLSSWKYRV